MTEVPQAPEQTGVPTCYRHPGRETHVRCVRCDRYICPDCMVEASVGFQCPECVREGNQGVRQAEGQFGGAVATKPYVSYVLIALNVLVYLGQLRTGTSAQQAKDYGLDPYLVADGEWWRLVTSMFVHDGPAHLAMNMLGLYWLGAPLEQVVGRYRFLVLYLLSGLGGSTLVYLTTSGAIGASGALYGVFAAFFVFAIRRRLDMKPFIFLIVINFMFTAFGANISWQGHVGGLVTGALLGIAYFYAPRARRQLVQVGASVVIGLIMLVLIIVQTVSLTS